MKNGFYHSLHDDVRLNLTGIELEEAARKTFSNLGSVCTKPSGNREDAVLTFPEYFETTFKEKKVRLKPKGTFIVEVKSSGRTGARSNHVRQLLEWLWYHNIADFPQSNRDFYLKETKKGFDNIKRQLENSRRSNSIEINKIHT